MRLLAATIVGCAAAALGTSPAQAAIMADPVAVADWQMNEATGATTMSDSSGSGITGVIGKLVKPGVAGPETGNKVYGFPGNWGVIPVSDRLVVVDESDVLDPNSGPWSVELRFKTKQSHPNIIQKGQATAPGGYWKIAMNSSGVTCHFRDGARNNMQLRPAVTVNDGAWHTMRCERSATGMAVTIDGKTFTRSGSIGPVNNAAKLFIGGKLNCDWQTVSCDPFVGQIDYVRVGTGV